MLRKLFGMLLALVIALLVIGFLLPTTVTIERQRVIEQPRSLVFDVLSDMRHFTQWAPWLTRQPEMTWRLEGPATGVGATLVWNETPESRASRLWIVAVDRPRRIDLEVELSGNPADSWFEVTDAEGGVRVSWGMEIRFGALDLVGRYVGLILPGLVGGDYAEGLERLDAYLADAANGPPALPERLGNDS
jgi:hypothetical protein